VIEPANLASPDFSSLLTAHALFCDGTAPPESCHRLPLASLFADDITTWQACVDGKIIGMGALKILSETDGEIKSMHTLEECRGLGVGRQMLETILEEAISRDLKHIWLETGSHSDFASAHKMYAAHGFVETGPFADYTLDPHSIFMTLKLYEEEEL